MDKLEETSILDDLDAMVYERDCIDVGDYIKGNWPLVRKELEAAKLLREIRQKVGIAGNHLGLVIGTNHLPYTTPTDEALEIMGAGKHFEIWVAWKLCYEAYVSANTIAAIAKKMEGG